MATVDRLNRDMGRGSVFFAGQGIQQHWKMQANMKSQAYARRLEELELVWA